MISTFDRRFVFVLIILIGLACGGSEVSPPVSNDTPVVDAPVDPSPPTSDGREVVTVGKVVDGDTIELTDGRRIRYIGINTPERDQPYYGEAKEINRLLVENRMVELEYDVEPFDKYGRTLAYIWVNGSMANLEIVRRGYANSFTVPPNVRYEAQFREAQREAREAELGLWAGSPVALKIIRIQADAPGDDRQNPNGEWIEIANQGNESVQMQGYTLKDEANHIYTFADFVVAPGRSFRLYSGAGPNNEDELYWGLNGESVWNNGGDVAFLRDGEGALVDNFSY